MALIKNPPQLFSEEEADEKASEAALGARLIDDYANLQRIKAAPDREKELDFQIRIVKAKLKQFGFDPERLGLE